MPTTPSSKYRPEIDGIRAFAVVAVIINHFNKDLLPSGYLGVDIFFVISGYVITSSLAGRESKNFLDFLTGFYERRIKRLVPALVVFVLITSVLICLFNPSPGYALSLGWRSLLGISNINLYRTSTDYFAQSTELNPFTHTWSLGVEEQFYLLFPFLIWFSGFGKQTAKGSRNLFFWVGAMTIASLIGFIYLYKVNQPAAYFLMPPRFWEMAAGCLLFIGFQKRARIEKALEKVPPLLVVAAMVGVMYLPVAAAVPATIGIVVLSAVLIACLKRGTVAYKFFTFEKVVFIGLISYSLYLWHWTVLCISRWTIGIHLWSVPLQVALMLILALVSFKWIETPIRHSHFLRQKPTEVFAVGVCFSLVSAVLLNAIVKSELYTRIYLGDKHISNQLLELGDTSKTYYKRSGWSISRCVYGDNRSIGRLIDIQDCLLSYDLPVKKINKKVLAIGNSFAVAQIRMLESFSAKGYDVYLAAGYNCPIAAGMQIQDKYQESCKYYNNIIVPRLISSLSSGDILILANDLSSLANENNGELGGYAQESGAITINGKPSSLNERLQLIRRELDDLIILMKAKRVLVVVQNMVPLMRRTQPPQVCVNIHAFSELKCTYFDKKRHERARQELSAMFNNIATRHSNLIILDLFALLCPDSKCTHLDKQGNLLYRDTGHLSDYASVEAGQILKPLIDKLRY